MRTCVSAAFPAKSMVQMPAAVRSTGRNGPGDGEERGFGVFFGRSGTRLQDNVRTSSHRLRGGQTGRHAGGPGVSAGCTTVAFLTRSSSSATGLPRGRPGADDRL